MSRFSPRARAWTAPLAVCASIVACTGWTATVHAQARALPVPGNQGDSARNYDIPAGSLRDALLRFSADAGVYLVGASEQAQGKTSPGLQGRYTTSAGFAALLAGTGLQAWRQADGSYGLRPAPAGTGAVTTLDPVRVSAGQDAALPPAYAGGQIATGGRLGMLGIKDVMDTPFNAVTYTATLIRDQQAKSVSDVLANNPSVRIFYPDSDGSTDFFIRGNKVSQLDIAYDGLYGIGTPGIESIERIDVLIGANALLNGLGPIGGVGGMINQVPKKALETPLNRVSFGYVSTGQFGTTIDLSRRFGPDDHFGIRLTGAYRDGDTAGDDQSQKVGTATLALDWRGENVRLSTNFGYRENDTQSPARTTYLLSNTFHIPAPPKDPRENWQNDWSYDNTKTKFATARGEIDITPDVTAYAAVGGSRMTEEELFANTFLLDGQGNIAQRTVYWPLYRDSVSAEAGVRGTLHTGSVKHDWSVAVSGMHVSNGIAQNVLSTTYSNIYDPTFIPKPSIAGMADAGGVPKTGETSLSGVAVADTLSFLDDKVQLTLGARQQNVDAKSFSEATGDRLTHYDKSAVTYAAGLNVRPTRNLSLYTNYIEGLQQGGTVPAGYNNSGAVLRPFVSKQYEVGAKYDFGGLLATLSAYQISTPNAQPNGLDYTSDGKQRTKGLELNLYGEVTRDIRVLGGVALIDARQVKTTNGANDGNKVSGASDVQVNLGAEWDPGILPGLTVSGRGIYTGPQYVDGGNQQSIPSWIRYDAGLRYQTVIAGRQTAFRFNVENIANKSYWIGGQGYLMQGRPRTYMLSVSVDL